MDLDRPNDLPLPVQERLGEGGLGEVFLDEDNTLQRNVVPKFLRVPLGSKVVPGGVFLGRHTRLQSWTALTIVTSMNWPARQLP